ncbi:MAG: GntR family transcriptional regulator [Desulforhopalus sp.]
MSDNKSFMKSQMAYEKIRDMILKGQKLPGSRLIIADLEKEIGLGKVPIREAIMRLELSGIVKNIPYKGAEVATLPTPVEILYIYQLRKDLESKLAVAAMKNITDSNIRELEDLQQSMMAIPKDNHYHLDVKFHQYIYSLANLPHLHNIAKTYIISVESVLNIFTREKDQIARVNVEHGEIIEALKSGDPDEVQKKMAKNIESGLAIIRDTYNNLINRPFE